MLLSTWTSFFAAMVSASATLTGLIFVGISINLNRILATPYLFNRGLESLIMLITILIVSALCLVPGETPVLTGCEFLLLGGIIWMVTLLLDINMLKGTEKAYKRHSRQNILFTQLAVLPYLISGIIVLNCGYSGLYWLIPGIIFSFIKAIMDAWVLLVEINR